MKTMNSSSTAFPAMGQAGPSSAHAPSPLEAWSSGTSSDGTTAKNGSSAPFRPLISNPVDQVMPPTDASGLHFSRELIHKCVEFVTNCIAFCRLRDTKPCPFFDEETNRVQPPVAHSYLSLLERTIPQRYAKLLSMWNELIKHHYSLLSYGNVRGMYREWIWTTHRSELMHALELGLVMERLVIEKRPGMGTGAVPHAKWTLRTEVLLFASDAQLYGITHQTDLQDRMTLLHELTVTHASPLLKKQFEF